MSLTKYNTESKRLDGIKIYSNDNILIKSFLFNYSYFVSSTSSGYAQINNVGNSDVKRLKLLSIQEMASLQSAPPYTFEYEQSWSLPRRMSCDQDHWGFANSSTGWNFRLTPDVAGCTSGGADRRTVDNFVKAWTLTKITYPTGGYSQFYFGVHM